MCGRVTQIIREILLLSHIVVILLYILNRERLLIDMIIKDTITLYQRVLLFPGLKSGSIPKPTFIGSVFYELPRKF